MLSPWAFSLARSILRTLAKYATPLSLNLQFDERTPGALIEGWEKTHHGLAMAKASASIQLGFDGSASTDGDLLVEAEARAKTTPPAVVIVRFNDHILGHWRLPSEPRTLRRRFIVPRTLINPDSLARLSFEYVGQPARPSVFNLLSLELTNLRGMNANGWVDRCSTEKIIGWAVVDGVPAPVNTTVDGEALPSTSINYERPDLERSALPIDAGFELIPSHPIRKGASVAVTFANGRHLHGSPCQP